MTQTGFPRTGLCPWGGYRVSASDDRRRNRENWPRPFGLRQKTGHTSFSPSTVDPPQPSSSASSPPHGRRSVRGGSASGPFFARNATTPVVGSGPRLDSTEEQKAPGQPAGGFPMPIGTTPPQPDAESVPPKLQIVHFLSLGIRLDHQYPHPTLMSHSQ